MGIVPIVTACDVPAAAPEAPEACDEAAPAAAVALAALDAAPIGVDDCCRFSMRSRLTTRAGALPYRARSMAK